MTAGDSHPNAHGSWDAPGPIPSVWAEAFTIQPVPRRVRLVPWMIAFSAHGVAVCVIVYAGVGAGLAATSAVPTSVGTGPAVAAAVAGIALVIGALVAYIRWPMRRLRALAESRLHDAGVRERTVADPSGARAAVDLVLPITLVKVFCALGENGINLMRPGQRGPNEYGPDPRNPVRPIVEN